MWQYTSIVWPFMLIGFIYIVWTNISTSLRDRKERMDYAEKSRREKLTEEKPWDAN